MKWHYRSKHGSLIAFSNQQFYDDSLIVFPSARHDHPDYGVKLVHINGNYGSGLNQAEAGAVVEATLRFMEENLDSSLGIVAVNVKQADLIREEMDRAFAANPRAEAFRARWEDGLEAFFVKNLENVQGDDETSFSSRPSTVQMQKVSCINASALSTASTAIVD